MNDDRRPERDAAPTAADFASTAGLLARFKRVSLGHQALRAAWHLDALVRRVEAEAPEAHRWLCGVVAELRLLHEQLSSQPAGDRAPRPNAAPDLPAGSLRQGELF